MLFCQKVRRTGKGKKLIEAGAGAGAEAAADIKVHQDILP
jgi:hypothetical protein